LPLATATQSAPPPAWVVAQVLPEAYLVLPTCMLLLAATSPLYMHQLAVRGVCGTRMPPPRHTAVGHAFSDTVTCIFRHCDMHVQAASPASSPRCFTSLQVT